MACPQDLPAGTAGCKLEGVSIASEQPPMSWVSCFRGHPATRWSPTARWLQPCSCVPAKQKHLFPSFFLSQNSLPHCQVISHRPGWCEWQALLYLRITVSDHEAFPELLCTLTSPILKVSSVRKTLHYVLQTKVPSESASCVCTQVPLHLMSFLFQMQVSETEPCRYFRH